MKQKIVIKLQPDCDKYRSKAMALAAQAGVDSVKMEGKNRDELVVVGDGVDPSKLTRALRRKLEQADIIEVNVFKKEEKKETKETTKHEKMQIEYNAPRHYTYHPQVSHAAVYNYPVYPVSHAVVYDSSVYNYPVSHAVAYDSPSIYENPNGCPTM